MKKILTLLSLTISLVFSNCSIYEDLYLSENGGIKYRFALDASELISMSITSSLPNMNTHITDKDTIIYFSDIISDSLDIVALGLEQDMENIAPLYMKIEQNKEENIYRFSICGDFKNAKAFTDVFYSMGKLQDYIKTGENIPKKNPSDYNYYRAQIEWDGTTFKRKFEPRVEDNLDEDDEENLAREMAFKMFEEEGMRIRYHFPKKIKSINNEDATFSLDRKTAIINCSAKAFLMPDDTYSLEIVTE